MGYSIGWDSGNNRWKGYGVPCTCEHPNCSEQIDRGMSHLCEGCGLAFCNSHHTFNFCEHCLDEQALETDVEELAARPDATPFPAKPEHPDWLHHLRTDESWAKWRADAKNMQQLEAWERATQAAKQGEQP